MARNRKQRFPGWIVDRMGTGTDPTPFLAELFAGRGIKAIRVRIALWGRLVMDLTV